MTHHHSNKTALVTGASGFLGSEVCATLRAAGWTVWGAARSSSRLPSDVSPRPVDLRNARDLRRLVAGAYAVVHCAGAAHRRDPSWTAADYDTLNGRAAGRLAAAARELGVDRFVLVSSSSVYGRGRTECRESDPCAPVSEYARSKQLGERLAREAIQGSATRLVTLRPATICGPDDPGNLRRLADAIAARRFVWIGDGGNRKSLVPRSGVCRLIERSLTDPDLPLFSVLNVAACSPTVSELVAGFARLTAAPLPRWRLPAQPIAAGVRIASALSAGRGPAARLAAALEAWRASDTIDNSLATARYGIDWPSLDGVLREQLGAPPARRRVAA